MRVVALALVALATVWPTRPWIARLVIAALGGAAVVASTWDASFSDGRNTWAVPLVVVAVVAVWWATPGVARALPTLGGAWLLLVGCAMAVYACVPETDQLWEVGVALVAAAVAQVLLRRPLPAPLLAAAAAWVVWAAAFGATGRGSALVGGLFAVVPFVVVAGVTVLAPALAKVPEVWRWLIGLVWVMAALVVARTGGIEPTTGPAVVAVALAAAGASVVTAAVGVVALSVTARTLSAGRSASGRRSRSAE